MCTFTFIKASNEPSLLGKFFYLDAGHGGIDVGASYKDIKESDINLIICEFLKDNLEKHGAIVYMTRVSDNDLAGIGSSNRKRSDLSTRARIINESGADMFISVHLNADISSFWSGAQVFYTNRNSNNKNIALLMQEQFKRSLNTSREAKEIENVYLFDRISVPGVLVEAGFLSNPNDRYLLTSEDYQRKIASIITASIINFYNN